MLLFYSSQPPKKQHKEEMGSHREPVGLTVHISWSQFQKELGERKSSIKTRTGFLEVDHRDCIC